MGAIGCASIFPVHLNDSPCYVRKADYEAGQPGRPYRINLFVAWIDEPDELSHWLYVI
jgi:hypothetical protein